MKSIRPAIAGIRDWLAFHADLGTTPVAGPYQRADVTDVVAYMADLDALDDAIREGTTAAPVPEGDDAMSQILRALAQAPARPDIKGPLATAAAWLESGDRELPVTAARAVTALADAAERNQDHRDRLADGLPLISTMSGLAGLTDAGHQYNPFTTREEPNMADDKTKDDKGNGRTPRPDDMVLTQRGISAWEPANHLGSALQHLTPPADKDKDKDKDK